MPDMVTWIMANKGKFAYSHVNDFTGAVVVQQFFYHYAGAEVGGSWKDFLGDFNEPLYLKRAPLVWQTLRSIESSLKMSSDGSYPAAHTIIRDWFAADEVWLDCSYDPNHAAQYILSGKYKETTKSYVLDTGTISNTNFVAIAANANNKAAAMVVGNMIGSLEAVFTRAQPERWGALPAIAANKQSVVDSGWDAAFDYIDSHASAPSVEELAAGRLTELRADYVQRLKTDCTVLGLR
jgi:putative spermidine/putrescine transport system substrate-binding protein